MVDVVASVLLLAGCFLAFTGALGLHRFPDVFTRMHAATKPVTLGLILVALGTALRLDTTSGQMKLLLAVMLQLLTAPVGAHMIGRAAHRAGELSDRTLTDALAEVEESEQRA